MYDVVVVGGGTAGCAAAYIAGKLGLKVLLLEKSIHLGGTMTSGLVIPVMKSGESKINNEFYSELIYEMKNLNGQINYQGNAGWFNPELLKIALDNMLEKSNVEVRFGTTIYNIDYDYSVIKTIYINNNSLSVYNEPIDIKNKILFEPIATKYVIDATGNCEIAKFLNCNFLENKNEYQPINLRFIMSGVNLKEFSQYIMKKDTNRDVTTREFIDGQIHLSTAYTWDTDTKWALSDVFALAIANNDLKLNDTNYFQVFTIAGMPDSIAFNCPRLLYDNNPYDVKKVSKALIEGRKSIYRISEFCKKYLPGFAKAFISNISDSLGIRVSRRIKGKYVYTISDLKSGKTFENPVLTSSYPIDVHSKYKNSSQLVQNNEYQLPIESLMSYDYDNLFVIGKCLSADFLAQSALRVQASCFSMGEGVARYINQLINKND